MHRATQRKLHNLGLASIALGCVVVAAFGLKVLLDSKSEPATSSNSIPFETSTVPEETATPATPTTPSPSPSDSAVTDGEHEVKITVQSDGAVRIGFKFTGGDEGLRDATRSFSISRTVRGTANLAQVGVQLQGATYATCSIAVDGAQKSTHRTNGEQSVAVCTA